MKNPCLSLLLVTLLLSFGCSKQEGKSEAKFKIGLAALTDINAVGAGGAMLWGRSDKGDMFGSVITPGSGFELSLVNGSWTFWSVAWEGNGSGAAFTGTIRCAKSQAVLNGTDVQVSLSLANSKCDLPDFTPSVAIQSGLKKFPDISTHECQKITDHNGIGCGEGVGAAKTASRRFVLSSFVKPSSGVLTVLPGRLVSDCKMTGVYFINEQIPVGNGVLPALTFLESFYSSQSCDESDPKGFRRSAYEYGLMGTAKLDTIKFVNEGSCDATAFSPEACAKYNGMYSSSCNLNSNQFEISQSACVANGGVYTAVTTSKKFQLITAIPDSEICSGPRVDVNNTTPHPFASGDGSISAPYTICKETQLNAIGESATSYASNYFSLQADLDMNKTSIIGDGSQPVPDCLEERPGSNFIPIGGLFVYPACTLTAPVSYNGTFNGNGHTISNIRIHQNDVDTLGFVRTGGRIKNLVLKNIEIEGSDYVGAVSGDNALEISNVMVDEAELRGNSNIGGVAGRYAGFDPISNVRAKKMSIRSEQSNTPYIGGLIGFSDAASMTIQKSSFEGHITHHATGEYVGGFLGKGNSGMNLYIKESFSNGVIDISASSGSYNGGMVGYMTGPATIENSYSEMSIGRTMNFNSTGSGVIGGLIGYSSGSVNLTNAFYYGSIMLPCNDGTATYCSINTLAAGATGTNYYGSLLNPTWYNSLPSSNTSLATIESGSFKANLISASAGKFVDVGTPLPKLAWESSPCAQANNNASVSSQLSASRGGSVLNPVVICNKEQWKQIAGNLSLNYSIQKNLALGDIAYADMPSTFNGSIDGNDFLVSGFLASLPTSSGGLFKQNFGKLSKIKFLSGVIAATGTAQKAGIVGQNMGTGVMSRNSYMGILLKGQAAGAGIIAGENSGVINFSKIESSIVSNSTIAGGAVGVNTSTGSVFAVRVDGMLDIQSTADVIIGGAVGKNLGVIQEVESGMNISNNINNSANSFIGSFVGLNEAIIKDALVKSHATFSAALIGPQYGHVIGQTSASSQVTRVIAVNEFGRMSGVTPYGSHFVAQNAGGASYVNSFALQGAVFSYDNTVPNTLLTCSESGGVLTYTMNGIFNTDATFPDGYFLSSLNTGDRISRRISGSHTDGTDILESTIGSHFTIPCGPSDVSNGVTFYSVKSAADFAMAGVTNTNPHAFTQLTTFCPSAASQAGNLSYKCNSGEFDMIEDRPDGIGFMRLKSLYNAIVNDQPLPTNRPIWSVEEGESPRLVITD